MPCSSGVDVSHSLVGQADLSRFCARAGPRGAAASGAHKLNAALKTKRFVTRMSAVLSFVIPGGGFILQALWRTHQRPGRGPSAVIASGAKQPRCRDLSG